MSTSIHAASCRCTDCNGPRRPSSWQLGSSPQETRFALRLTIAAVLLVGIAMAVLLEALS